MKKFFQVLIIAMIAIALLGGCKRGSSKIKIGVAISSFNDTFLMYMKDGMEEYAASLGENVSVTYVDGKEDAAKQLEQVENFITQGMKSIVVVPVNTQATKPITDACIKAKVNLVYVNRLPNYLPEGVVFVGSDSIKAGLLQMEYLADKLDGKGNVVVMMGKLDNEAAVARTEGVKQICDKYPELQVTKQQTAEWSRAKGMTLMENWLATGDPIAAVASNNDDMALGAIKALEAAGKLDEIMVAGIDATKDALVELEKGKLTCTVFQDASGQGSGSIKAAYDLATGVTVEKEVWIPFQLVTPENYKDFMN
ncbi:MAG: sugar ABC transporter substrate-binding protein [Spirochaetes bacterium]|nr:sugar ABC transporter substrate-binding protein [Spirochaetota bacterium]